MIPEGERGRPAGRSEARLDLGPGLLCLVAANPGPLTLDGTRTYLVGGRRAVVIDPGPAIAGRVEALLDALAGLEAEAVCLTHAHSDHAGCAPEAAAALGAPLAAGAATLRRLGAAGRALDDGDELPVDGGRSRLRALHTPGHSGDHLSYLWLPGRQLFSGDLVLGRGSSVVAHPDGSVGAYLESLSRLAGLRPTRILPGHGPPVDRPLERLEEYRRHRLERDGQVLAAVRGGAVRADEVQARVYGDLADPLARAARLSVLAHLRHLLERGHALPRPLLEELKAAGRGPAEGTRSREEP